MLRELLRKLTGNHVALIIVTCILAVPGALIAAVTFSPVAIVDTTTGKATRVDGAGRLWTTDTFAAYRSNPANFVRVSGFIASSGLSTLYTVPAGKSLIITAASLTYFNGIVGNDNSIYCYFGANPQYMFGMDNPASFGSQHFDLGNGIFVHAMNPIGCLGSNSSSSIPLTYGYSLIGYLVPDTATPQVGTAEFVQQSVGGTNLPRKQLNK